MVDKNSIQVFADRSNNSKHCLASAGWTECKRQVSVTATLGMCFTSLQTPTWLCYLVLWDIFISKDTFSLQLYLVNRHKAQHSIPTIKCNSNHHSNFNMPHVNGITPRHKCVPWSNSSCFIKVRKWGEASVLCTPRARSRQMNNRGKHNDSTGLAPHTHWSSVQTHKAAENGFKNPQKLNSDTVTIRQPKAPHTCSLVRLKEINTATKCIYKRLP